MPITPYNTGKVKIGCHYVPPQRNYMTPESEHWQNIFIDKRSSSGEFWRWVLFIGACVAFMYWGLR